MDKTDKVWKERPDDPEDEDPVNVKGVGIQITAPVDVCNNILSQLIFAKDDINASWNHYQLFPLAYNQITNVDANLSTPHADFHKLGRPLSEPQ